MNKLNTWKKAQTPEDISRRFSSPNFDPVDNDAPQYEEVRGRSDRETALYRRIETVTQNQGSREEQIQERIEEIRQQEIAYQKNQNYLDNKRRLGKLWE